MATIEYRCKKCGFTFIDLDTNPIHERLIDNDGVDLGKDCNGEGEPMYEFPNQLVGIKMKDSE